MGSSQVLTKDADFTYDPSTKALLAGGVLQFKAGTSFKAIFTHADSADRTYTLQDASMTLAGINYANTFTAVQTFQATVFTQVNVSAWSKGFLRIGRDQTDAGDATTGSGNQSVLQIQSRTPSATNSLAYNQKTGIQVWAWSADPTDYVANPIIKRPVIAADIRAQLYNNVQLGRAFGIYAEAQTASGSDGLLYAAEFATVNNSTADQASTGTTTSKYGIHIVSDGTQNSTAAIYVDSVSGAGKWHKAIWIDPSSIVGAAGDSAIAVSTRFVVDVNGQVTFGTNGFLSSSGLSALRTFTFQNSDYEVAGVDIAQTFTQAQTITVTDANPLIINADAMTASRVVRISGYANSVGIDQRRANGTLAAPTAVVNTDGLGQNRWFGHDGSAFANAASIAASASENWTTIAHGTRMSFAITQAGTIVNTTILRLDSDLTVLIGTNLRLQLTDSGLTAKRQFLFPDAAGTVVVTGASLGQIVNADVNASAAIAYSKLNLAGSIVNADIAVGAAIAYSKLSLTGSIVNADVSGSAAIAYSKLNLSASIVNADVAVGAAIAYSKLTLTGSIVDADVSGSAAIAKSKISTSGTWATADLPATVAYTNVANVFTAAQTITVTNASPLLLNVDAMTAGRSLTMTGYANNFSITQRRANNTLASPTALASSDTIGSNAWQGHDGTGFSQGALISILAAEAWTGTAHGTRMNFSVTQAATTTNTAILRLDSDLTVLIGANLRLQLADTGLTAKRAFTFPDTAGVVVVDAAVQTISGAKTFSGGITVGTAIAISDVNVVLGTVTGTKFGTATSQKLAFYNSTPIVQPSTTGETVGFTAGAGTAVTDQSTFTGNVGATAYRISDIVKHLKNLGLVAA